MKVSTFTAAVEATLPLADVPGVTVSTDQAAFKICVTFAGKPEAPVRALMTRNGFKWSHARQGWTRNANTAGRAAVHHVLGLLLQAIEAKLREDHIDQ